MKLIEYITNYFSLLRDIELTASEARVLYHLTRGLTILQIAELTNKSIHTIRKQIQMLHVKFNVRTNHQLVVEALKEINI